MKKLMPFLFLAMLSFSGTLIAQTTSENTPTANKLTENQVNSLVSRYKEINETDKSDLTSEEKRNLKNEQSQIKDDLKANGDPVVIYLSTGLLLVLIIILLIILL